MENVCTSVPHFTEVNMSVPKISLLMLGTESVKIMNGLRPKLTAGIIYMLFLDDISCQNSVTDGGEECLAATVQGQTK